MNNSVLENVRELFTTRMWGCLFLSLIVFSAGIVNNAYLYAAVTPLFPEARECAAIFEALVYVALFFVALRRPSLIRGSFLGYSAAVICVVIVPLLCYAFCCGNTLLITVGMCLRSCCRAVLQLFLVVALLDLKNVRGVALVTMLGVFGSRLCEPLLRAIPNVYVATCAIAIAYVLAIRVGMELGQNVFPNVLVVGSKRSQSSFNEALKSAQIARFVVCVLLFCVATGYARCSRGVDGAAVPINVEASFLVLLVLFYLFVKKVDFVDAIFSLSVVLVFAGFLCAPLTLHIDSSVASTCLMLGGCCFEVLLWMVLAGIGERNILLLMPVFALTHCARQVGTVVGAVTANASMAIYQNHASLSASLALSCAFAFFVFLWMGFRDFSFSRVIFGIREEPLQDSRDTIATRCAELSREKGLTAREREILELLARGRNTAFIMGSLVLSRNTVRSHVKHTYSKLGIHSHQELIDLFYEDGDCGVALPSFEGRKLLLHGSQDAGWLLSRGCAVQVDQASTFGRILAEQREVVSEMHPDPHLLESAPLPQPRPAR